MKLLPTRRHRTRTPIILQMEAVECGAATLAIILGYYRKFVPLAELRRECGVSRDGSKASNVLRAARRYGMKAKGFSKSIESIREIKPPFIVFWNFNHFLVVEGFRRDRVYLNDPANGHQTVTNEEFDNGFTGVALVFERGPDFKTGGRKASAIPGLIRRMKGNTPTLSFCLLAGLLLVLPGLAIPTFTRVFIDSIILDGRYGWFRPLLVALAGTMLLQLSLHAMQMFYLRRLRISLAAKLKSQFFWHALKLSTEFYAQRFPGEIVGRANLNDRVSNVLSSQLVTSVIDVTTMVIYGAVMFNYSADLTMIGIANALVIFMFLRWFGKRRIESNMKLAQEMGKLQGLTIAGIQSVETLKASGAEDGFFKKWSGYFAKSTNAQQELQYSAQALGVLPSFLGAITTMLILVLGAIQVIEGEMTIGMLVAFQGLMGMFLRPVGSLVGLGSVIQELQGDLIRLDDVLENPPQSVSVVRVRDATWSPEDTQSAADQSPLGTRLDGRVELRGLTFGYSPLDPPLIEDLDLLVEPGHRVALVGGSGSGKSTVSKLVAGLYQPWAGEILFDSMPRTEIPSDLLTNSIAMVEQHIFLFEGTVRQNLTLWDKTITDAALSAAVADAYIEDAVAAIPGGFEGMLMEGGSNLSGGQRQRLEIARALVGNPRVLVLDEATSALDSETELIIDANLRRRGCTCIIVAHRLSTIRDCDEIIVFRRGKVVERGTHEELWSADGPYARLLQHAEATAAP